MVTLILILLPLLSGFALLLAKGNATKMAALAVSVMALLAAIFLYTKLDPNAGVQFAYSLPWLPDAGIHFSLGIDGLSMLLILLTTLLCPVIILSTFQTDIKNPSAFYALILIMESGLLGVFTARDAFCFYLFWEAALIPVYFLAAIWGGTDRVRVTFKFFIYTIFGSLFMLASLVYLYYKTPGAHSADLSALYALELDHTEQGFLFGGLFIAFAIKMPIFPFHTWQPDTYTESPTAATMLLSGIMLKMGLYGVVRWLMPIVPEGMTEWSMPVMVLSVIGIIYGSIIAIQQQDVKRLIAYSSFAHVGLMCAGIFSGSLIGLQGALIQMFAHGVNVVGLFMVAEVIAQRTNTREIANLGGITRSTPQLSVFFVVLMLGSVALPLTNGFIGEFMLLSAVFKYNSLMGVLAGLTIILGAVYMLRMFQRVMLGNTNERTEGFKDLNMTETIAFLPLIALVLWIGIYPKPFLALTEPTAQELLRLAAQASGME
ncbi:MAG: NADH-quinone oxidoreductase subunit M [Cytophagales bacterium]|nr:MAG: NADH-quinone oxidoreductase subunit M [Cytophagales bacterium]TAF61340.1 MAG: NADH-quinone oxidoreductase subunit M [Cytophagales bacterium]